MAIDKDKVFELFGRYWEIAYNEGRTGEGFPDIANDVLAELRDALDADDEQRGWADDLRKAADEIDRLRDKARLYEELRAVVDGGSESMTHADAIREIRWLQDFAEGESEA